MNSIAAGSFAWPLGHAALSSDPLEAVEAQPEELPTLRFVNGRRSRCARGLAHKLTVGPKSWEVASLNG
jgi:hypothetical protein